MKRVYINPQIRIVSLYPHTFITASKTDEYMGDDPLGPGGSSNKPSRWFNDDIWDDSEDEDLE